MTEVQQVLMNHYEPFDSLPDEIISDILILIDPDTLFVLRLVCKRWQRLIDTYVFQEKAARENKFANNGRGYYSFSHIHPNDVRSLDFPWYVFYTICKHDPFNRNLVETPGEQDVNEYEYWNNPNSASLRDVINAPPSVSMVRQNLLLPPHGVANEIAASYPDYVYVNNVCLLRCRNFYGIDKKIIFKDNGINQNVMKSLLPEISFSAWVHNQRHRHYKFKLRAIIHDEFDNSIAHHFACPSETQHEYIKTSSSFQSMGNEFSLTLHHKIDEEDLTHTIFDTENLKIFCSVVKVLLPKKFKLKLPEPKMCI